MSQQIPFPSISQERNVYVKVLSRPNNKVRSGIIERYTYKTDNGKLLSSTSLNKNYNADGNVGLKSVNTPKTINTLHTNLPSVSRTTIIKTNVNTNLQRSLPLLPTKHHVIHQNVTVLKLNNSKKKECNEIVRTEHCDSTTDIIENMEKDTHNSLRLVKAFTNNDDCYKNFPTNSKSIFKKSHYLQQSDIDSDSDCQIIDVKLNESKRIHVNTSKDRYIFTPNDVLAQKCDKPSVVFDNIGINEESPNTKVLSWISNKVEDSQLSEVHVISDTDEEDDNSNIFLCNKTGVKRSIKEIEIKKSVSRQLEDNNEKSNSLSLNSEKTSPDILVSTKNMTSKSPVHSLDLINARYHSVMNHFHADKRAQIISNLAALNNKKISPKLCTTATLLKTPTKPVTGHRLETTPPKVQKLNVQIQRVNSQLSPESMKSEFYSYLKINTNPSAQKAEAVAQNRRSIRVKNLVLQIEKNKELKNDYISVTKDKQNDVRKKFMKYSKFNIIFPPPPIQHNKISDFNHSIQAYFLREKIKNTDFQSPSKLVRNNDVEDNRKNITRKYRTSKTIESISNIRNKYIKKKSLKQKKDITYSSQIFVDKQMRRLRFGPNRINTSGRITRNSLNGCKMWNIKMLKTKKAKLKAKMKDKNFESFAQKVNKKLESIEIKSKQCERRENDKIIDENTSSHIINEKEKIVLPIIPAKNLSNVLCVNNSENEYVVQNKCANVIENRAEANVETRTKLQNDKQSNEDIKSPEITTYLLKNSKEKESQMFCHSTPIYKNDSEKELEFFTYINTDKKAKDKENLQDNLVDLRKLSLSPPFLGFTSDENKKYQNVQNLVLNFNSCLSKNKDIEEHETLISEVHNNDSELTNVQLPDVISLSSSDNNTSLEEDLISEQFSETSSVHEEPQITVQEVVDTTLIQCGNPNYIPLNQNIKAKSFHKSLMQSCVKRKSVVDNNRSGLFELSDSDSSMSTPKTPKGVINKRSQTHEIDINKNNGAVFNTYYINGILIIVQEQLITFWKQTALGNILGVQNMWLPHGSTQRIILDPGCVNRRSSEMVLSCDNAVAYIELWTKEHKCMFRECPIADVFATIYFHKAHGLPDKKVLQLENIKGYGDDVRFAVIKNSREIIVSWCDKFSKPIKTLVRSYQLAPDFQTVSSIKEMEFVSHYISSLHNIHDCDDLILGAGYEQISVWNLKHGYLVTTLNLSETPSQNPSETKTICLYVQCDTGFLFLIQQTEVGILRLVAVNGMTQEWKQLHSYQVPDNYNKLLGVIVESGVLMTCYTNGFLCWNMHSGEVLAEIDTPNELIVLPSNNYLVAIDNYQVTVQHIMSYILTHDW